MIAPFIAGLLARNGFEGAIAGYLTITLPLIGIGVLLLLQSIGILSVSIENPLIGGIISVIGTIALISSIILILLSLVIGLVGAVIGAIGGAISSRIKPE